MILPPELLARVDEWRQRQTVPPTRAAAIRHLIEGGLSRECLFGKAGIQLMAELIVAQEGRGHNDPPFFDDYDAETQARYADEARWIIDGLAEHSRQLTDNSR